ncbi:LacI family DNA-binding transcriptional regulator [Hyunsoonleella sp. 2307UL5-6]|uniref:LacI family DNA-binding transcriptional regulator n=1 Tax=Hyunsoonleella sp. 2307UL5-6 TaxID=3384768 RepID=UPI0039BC966B
MNTGKVTIHDISKALNIDSSTVSRALNNSVRVSKTTKEKILAKAKELGYQRNSLASNLRTNKTNTIGVVVPRISRHFFSTVIAGIEETAYDNGYNVVICQSLEQLKREQIITETLVSNRVDGLLISISMQTTSFEHLEAFEGYGAPIVFYDRPCNFKNSSSVSIDDFEASFKATEHLILQGCNHIVHFGGPQDITLYQNRKEGYKAALVKHGLGYNPDYFFSTKLSEEDGVAMAKKIVKFSTVDGIVSANDTAAISAMRYLKSVGKHIPKDIAVVGFNNDPISAVIEPSLTTINQADFNMGKKATMILIEQIKNNRTTRLSVVLESELIVRDSSKYKND